MARKSSKKRKNSSPRGAAPAWVNSPAVPADIVAAPKTWMILLGLIGLAILVSLNALNNAFVLDDITKIVENLDIRSLANIPGKLIYPYHTFQVLQRNDPSRPLVFLVYTLVYSLVGLKPWLYHLVSVIGHGASAGLVFLIARRVQTKFFDRDDWRVPLVPAIFFILTPIQMGTVIYAYGLSDILSGVLMLASVWLYVRQDEPDGKSLAWSVGALVLALGCKQSAVVIPALLVLWDFIFVADQKFSGLRGRVRYYKFFFALVAIYLGFRLFYFGGMGDLESYAQTLPAGAYAFTQPWVVAMYALKTFVPFGLAIDHFVFPQTVPDHFKVLALVFWAGLVSFVIYKSLRSARWRLVALGLGWYLLCVAPTSSFMPTVDLIVERRVYLANVGLFFIWLWPVQSLLTGDHTEDFRKLAGAAMALYALTLGSLTLVRNHIFSSSESVWHEVLAQYPDSQRALNSLGVILDSQHRYDEAYKIFDKLVKLYPLDYVARGNFGSMLERPENPHRDINRALALFEESSKINPTIAENYYNIGRLLHLQGRLLEARPLYEKTLQLKPNFVPAMNNIAAIDIDSRDYESAKKILDETLRLDPGYGPAHSNMELLMKNMGLSPSGTKAK